MKKLLSVILALTVFLSVFTVASAADETVTEAPVSEKHLQNVEMLYDLGIGDYSAKVASEKITRDEFAQLMADLLGADDMSKSAIPFMDVEKCTQ